MPHVALITGAASGIGAATARLLAGLDHSIVVADIDATRGEALASELRASGGNALFAQLDVVDRADWEAARHKAVGEFGPIDILINNAGVFRDRTVLKLSDMDWDSVMDVNLKAAWIGIQSLLPGMREKGWGRILNVASSAHRGSFGQANYSAAKGGLVSLTRTVAVETVKFGILVNAIAPHNVNTPILDGVSEDMQAEWLSKSRFGRFVEAEEIAAVIEFFVSERNSVVTGQLLEVDGGDLVGLP